MIIGGYHAPKGATLRFPHFLLHRDPEIWDDPVFFILFFSLNHHITYFTFF